MSNRWEEIRPQVEAERLSLVKFLEGLREDEWAVRSLCTDWTVHEVLAHLTLSTRTGVKDWLKGLAQARFDFDRMESQQGRERAAQYSPAELIEQYRETAGSTRRSPLSGAMDPLVDVLVHGQDIARPLGREREIPLKLLPGALDHLWNSPFYGVKKRFRGTRMIATDVQWTAGDGPAEVRGPATELLLAATGRPSGLDNLQGEGVELVRATL
ncbi:uncharacterized protein (TIGR03083 family) [Kribbella amoyensis]|uniref:Uncharacterized protein (TIGR03083 family) n=1 Tax=Kribbella amoyensis TaxID=996641 RepID=A0A561BRL6_9ACTN|nr:maleylpyruvate isomerase family mycothiol-dependent enzyme [Kribbella amoyensis]TWD81412.1 uncharacterized protein (TIGR03083 family) [Kribbella amoyensis]